MSTPVTVMGGIEELRQRVAAGHHSYAIALSVAISRKTIHLAPDLANGWAITNHIDDTEQWLTDAELWTESHIGLALDRQRLGDMSGNDGIVNVEGRGWIDATTWLKEVRDAQPPPPPNDDPLAYTIADGPGAVRLGEGDWEPADPELRLEPCDIGPATVAMLDIAATAFIEHPGGIAATSIELTIEDIDGLVATLTRIKEDAIANRGFAIRADGYWTNGLEDA